MQYFTRIWVAMVFLAGAWSVSAQTDPSTLKLNKDELPSFKAAADRMEANKVIGSRAGHTDASLMKYA